MSTLNRDAYIKLLEENRVWLLQQPRTLERDHIDLMITWQMDYARLYGTMQMEMASENKQLRELLSYAIRETRYNMPCISDYCQEGMDKLRIPQ